MFVRGCAEEGPRTLADQVTGSYITTTPPVGIALSVNRYLASHGWSVVSPTSIFARYSPEGLFSFTENEEKSKSEAF